MPDSSFFNTGGRWDQQIQSVPRQSALTAGSLYKGVEEAIGRASQVNPGPMQSLVNFVSGKGALNINDSTGKFQLSPGGSFNLNSPQGFSVTGNPINKSLGVTVPFGKDQGKGAITFEGSWNQYDPNIGVRFEMGKNKIPSLSNPEQSVTQSLQGKEADTNDLTLNFLRQKIGLTSTVGEPSAREQANQLIDLYRSSGGRQSDSPSTWSLAGPVNY